MCQGRNALRSAECCTAEAGVQVATPTTDMYVREHVLEEGMALRHLTTGGVCGAKQSLQNRLARA